PRTQACATAQTVPALPRQRAGLCHLPRAGLLDRAWARAARGRAGVGAAYRRPHPWPHRPARVGATLTLLYAAGDRAPLPAHPHATPRVVDPRSLPAAPAPPRRAGSPDRAGCPGHAEHAL